MWPIVYFIRLLTVSPSGFLVELGCQIFMITEIVKSFYECFDKCLYVPMKDVCKK